MRRFILLSILLILVLWYANQVEYRHVERYFTLHGQTFKMEYSLGMSRLNWAGRDLDKMIAKIRGKNHADPNYSPYGVILR